MIPHQPNQGFKREANAQHQQTLSTLQKVVRYAEKDDFLLYLTAAFECSKKMRKKCKNEFNRRSTTIFYCGDCPETKEIAYKLTENLHFDPFVAKLSPLELEKAKNSKSLHIYILNKNVFNRNSSSIITRFSEFVDWLDELKYEKRERSYLRHTHFVIIYINDEKEEEEEENNLNKELINSFENKLISLESKQLNKTLIIEGKQQFTLEFFNKLNDLLKQFNYGEFDLLDAETDIYTESESE
uniref:Uncharacterized protein n=1 Tax=Meloidogyne incognita TaxID=6306 RepID=A0A914NJ48_MELIC